MLNTAGTHKAMESLTITQFIAGQVEALLYDKLHQLLGLIAEDYELSHGELVEKYLVYQLLRTSEYLDVMGMPTRMGSTF